MNDAQYKVLVSADAVKMIDIHIAFLARNDLSAANELREELITKMINIADAPYLYPKFFSESHEFEYRKIVYKQYIIIYSIEEANKTVHVKHIWYSWENNNLPV